jgi:hypothetical protein
MFNSAFRSTAMKEENPVWLALDEIHVSDLFLNDNAMVHDALI